MKYRTLFLAVAAGMFAAACVEKPVKADGRQQRNDDVQTALSGDSTIYGLACDGCNDTVIVLLRQFDNNPDTFNVLDAFTNRRIFGRPSAGDELAVVREPDDSTMAHLVINVSQLKGAWCYMVTPRLRRRAGMTTEVYEKLVREMPDSIRERLMQPREYGFNLKGESVVRPIGVFGRSAAADNGPAEYPKMKHYREWHIFNGRLVLNVTPDSLDKQRAADSDTADLVRLRRDTLLLRFANGTEQEYYRKETRNNE
jgi:hypothetical protein